MDAQLNVLSSTASNPLSIGENQPSAAGKRPGERAMLGQEFANLMRSLLPESERQDLATVAAVATTSGLKTQHLGSQFDLITSTSPQPDEDSLAAFAKSQGLADSAVQALFGNLQPLSEKAMQLASAGMNLHVFTTGRGTPYGLAPVPVIKVATRSDLARRWHDLMDINAGTIADGDKTIDEVGWELFHFMLDVASGRKKTYAEQWKLHNALVLFNPAPVT